MANTRDTRDSQTREKTNRNIYVPSSALPDPTPEPGYRFRYIATAILGQQNPTNVSKRFREGWEPVKAADHPELMVQGDANGNVEIGGLMLCKVSEEYLQSQKEYFDKQAKAQMDSVDNHYMRNNDPRMPLFNERKSSTSRGSGFGNGSR
jgi:hypothetical protein